MALVDKAQSVDEIADLLVLFETLSEEELESALPALVFLAEKCPVSLKPSFMDLAYCILIDANCSRSGRKAVFACLRILTHDEEPIWSSFFTLSQCLEEPQFHIINPVLPRMDEILTFVYKGRLSFKWASVVFFRALAHSNGWVRSWALEKLVSVEAPTMAANAELVTFFGVAYTFAGRDIIITKSVQEKCERSFVEAVLNMLSKLSSPTSLFFLSEAVGKIRVCRCIPIHDLMLIKTLIQKTQYIQHTAIRLMTLYNFVAFYCNVLELVGVVFFHIVVIALRGNMLGT
ncbi:unnamed protein product [Strongylus vulgaris]|uniref:Integrator complex subunit 7 n=1 Tax=Strongylus vulgaris TaxID=40348 RepID=A0A3P7IDI7_STRVU|nr:unnamed protein product [Strongylus vulgaris]